MKHAGTVSSVEEGQGRSEVQAPQHREALGLVPSMTEKKKKEDNEMQIDNSTLKVMSYFSCTVVVYCNLRSVQ